MQEISTIIRTLEHAGGAVDSMLTSQQEGFGFDPLIGQGTVLSPCTYVSTEGFASFT